MRECNPFRVTHPPASLRRSDSADRALLRRGGSGDLRRLGVAADGACWQVPFGTLCSSRDDQAFYPHLRVALATGVCGSQQSSAAFEIAVVKCMILCVRSLIEMLARKHVHIIL